MINEFDLDAPTRQRSERLRFRSETRCVTALFERCYQPSKATGNPWKVLVEVVDAVERDNVIDLLGVLTVQVKGVVPEFVCLPDVEKMEWSLDFLMRGISKIAEQRDWDIAPFRAAEAEVRRRDFRNEWAWKPPVHNRSKSLSAEVLVQYRVDRAVISARFTDSRGDVVRIAHLVSDEPNEFIFNEYFGTFGWLDDHTVELVSRNGEKRFTAQSV
jgi:hypothetical protein